MHITRDRAEREESPKLSSLRKQDTIIRYFIVLKPTTQYLPTLRRISEAEGADIAGMDEIIRIFIKMKKSAVEKHENNWIYIEAI